MKTKTQNPARLALYFCFCFAVVLLGALVIRFLELRAVEFRAMPGLPVTRLPELVSSLRWALAPALYASILLSLSYASRRNISIFISTFMLLALCLGAVFGISWGTERLREFPFLSGAAAEVSPFPGPHRGLILSQSGTSIILLKGPAESRGPRVVSLPGEPLIYQEVSLGPNNTALSLPPLPFRNETGPQLTGLFIDFALTARQLEDRFWEGLVPFFSYTAALSLLLLSLRFILDAGRWPLASFFVGALAFRGALALETFLNTGEAQDYLAVFTGDWAPRALISPLIFAALALVIFLFTGLVHLVKPGGAKNV